MHTLRMVLVITESNKTLAYPTARGVLPARGCRDDRRGAAATRLRPPSCDRFCFHVLLDTCTHVRYHILHHHTTI